MHWSNLFFYNSGLDVTHNRVSIIIAHYVSVEDKRQSISFAAQKTCGWQTRYGRAAGCSVSPFIWAGKGVRFPPRPAVGCSGFASRLQDCASSYRHMYFALDTWTCNMLALIVGGCPSCDLGLLFVFAFLLIGRVVCGVLLSGFASRLQYCTSSYRRWLPGFCGGIITCSRISPIFFCCK